MKKIFYIILLSITLTAKTFAVPPPDFILQVISNLWIYFAISLTFIWGIFFSFYHYIKQKLLKYKKKFVFSSVLIILVSSFSIAYIYDEYQQNQQIENFRRSLFSMSWTLDEQQIKEFEKYMVFEEGYLDSMREKNIEVLNDNELQNCSSFSFGGERIQDRSLTIEEKNCFNNSEEEYISNEELKSKIDSGKQDFIILDAREDTETEMWKIPQSIHIRFADLKDGKHKKLDKTKNIYVYCRSWVRGKEVSEYLRQKWFKARYLKKWVSFWYGFWGDWIWEIKFDKIYGEKQYKKVFSSNELQTTVEKWAILIDSRWTEKQEENYLSAAIDLPLVDLPKSEWDKYIKKIPQKSKIIVLCDNYTNCFYAKIIWIELEKRWHSFLWRYSLAYKN